MRVKINNQEYLVKWKNQTVNKITGTGFPYRSRETICSIYLSTEDDTGAPPISQGMVSCYFKDLYEHDEGRKRSLKRALENAIKNVTIGSNGDYDLVESVPLFSKRERELFWDTYRILPMQPRWTNKPKIVQLN